MINALYLCGTVHLDLAGPERLRRVFETVKPDCIAIESYPELSQDILDRRKEFANLDGKVLLQRIKDKSKISTEGVRADSTSALLNCVGYEVWIPFEYTEKSNAQIVQIEDKDRAQKITKCFLEDILNDSKKAEPFIEMLKHSPKTLKNIFDFCYELETEGNKDACEVVERNRVFADRISALSGRVLAITGLSHLYGIEPSLQTLLKRYNPTTFKLIEADYFGDKEPK